MKRILSVILAAAAAIAVLTSCAAGGVATLSADKADIDPLGLHSSGQLGKAVQFDEASGYTMTIPTDSDTTKIYNKSVDFLGRSGSVVIREENGAAQEIAYSFMDNSQLYEDSDAYKSAVKADVGTFINVCSRIASDTGSTASCEYTLAGETKTIDFTADAINSAISGDTGDKLFRETFVSGSENIIVILGVYSGEIYTIMVSYMLAA